MLCCVHNHVSHWLQLLGRLEAQCPELIQADHIYMACLAWGHLGNTASALDGVRRHEPLTAAWTAEQQQLAFQSMLSALKLKASDDSAVQVTQHVWMIAVSNNLSDRQQQLHDFVMALLAKGCLPKACEVSDLLHSCSNGLLHEAIVYT